jgi:hypothetical protein
LFGESWLYCSTWLAVQNKFNDLERDKAAMAMEDEGLALTALETTTGSVGANGAGWMMQAVIRRAATGNAALVDTSFVNHAFKDSGFSGVTPTITLASNVLTITCPSSNSIGINYKVTCEVLSTITVE